MRLREFPLLAVLLALTACQTTPEIQPETAAKRPLTLDWFPYAGPQQWPTAAGGFHQVTNGNLIFSQGELPATPYRVLGRLQTIYPHTQAAETWQQAVSRTCQEKGASFAIVIQKWALNKVSRVDCYLCILK